jgi:MAC/Perforin domain
LGRGIDLIRFDPFGKPSVKPTRILVDIPSVGVIEKLSLPAAEYKETYADSLLKITHILTVAAGVKGSYGDFSGSVNSSFGLTEKRTEKRHFLKISFVASGHSYNIAREPEALKKELTGGFKTALATGNTKDLFDVYGTHLIKKMIIGGRAEYFCRSSDIFSMTAREFKIAAKAKYKGAGGKVGTTTDNETIDKNKLRLVEGSESINTIGGSSEAAYRLKDGAWDEWAKSCEKYPGFLGFDEADGLLPIWELLAETDPRRAVIHEAYKRMAAKALRTEIFFSTSAKEQKDPEASVTIPEGYKLLSGGARANYKGVGVYLTASFPESNTTWRANGHDLYENDNSTISAFAIALYDPLDLWKVTIFESPPSGDDKNQPWTEKAVDADYVMVGGGARVNWGSYNSKDPNVLFASYPVNEQTWGVHSKDQKEHGKESQATITAYAIGLKCNVTGVKVETDIRRSESKTDKLVIAEARPASGCVMAGGGASVQFNTVKKDWLLLTESYPKDDNVWCGNAKDNPIHPNDGVITVGCIGLKVVDAK